MLDLFMVFVCYFVILIRYILISFFGIFCGIFAWEHYKCYTELQELDDIEYGSAIFRNKVLALLYLGLFILSLILV